MKLKIINFPLENNCKIKITNRRDKRLVWEYILQGRNEDEIIDIS